MMKQADFFLVTISNGPKIALNASSIVFLAPSPDGSATLIELISGKSISVDKRIEDLVPGYAPVASPAVDLPAHRD